MVMSDGRNDSAGYLGWFLLGAVLGGAAAYLTAPRAGGETREMLAARGSDVARRAQDIAGEAQTQAGEWLDKSRELFEEQTQRLVAAFEAGKEAMRDEIRKWSTTRG
jgi:gas vesicle protein